MIKVNIPTTLVNELLKNISVSAEISKFGGKIELTSKQLTSARTSTLGQTEGTVNGLKSLTINFDEFAVGVESIPGVIEITPEVPGYSSLLTSTISTTADLGTITEGTVSNGSLNQIISSNGTRSIKGVLKNVTNVAPDYNAVVSDVVPSDLQDVGSTAYSSISDDGNTTEIVTNVGSDINILTNNLDRTVGTTATGVLDNVSLDINNYVEIEIRSVCVSDITDDVVLDATQDIIVRKDYNSAIERLTPFSKVSTPDLEEKITSIPTAPSTQITPFSPSTDIFGEASKKIKDVHPSSPELWRGKNTDLNAYVFTEVSSMEELVAEFRSMTREVTEFVAHWTAHYNNQGWIGAKEIHETCINRDDVDFDGAAYHYIIKKNGVIERARPVNITGAHARGHNKYSIGISFVAGYNCNSGTKNPENYVSAESITQAQFKSFDKWVQAFYTVWPGGQAFGHNDTDPNRKPDPGFDVPEYVYSKFGKKNVIAASQGPLSPSDLNLIS